MKVFARIIFGVDLIARIWKFTMNANTMCIKHFYIVVDMGVDTFPHAFMAVHSGMEFFELCHIFTISIEKNPALIYVNAPISKLCVLERILFGTPT